MNKHGILAIAAGFLATFAVSFQPAVGQMEKMLLQQQEEAERAAKAAEEAAAAPDIPAVVELNKTGEISVVRDEAGQVSEIRLIVLSYNIAMDDKAKLLAGLEGRKVKITGEFQGSIADRDERFFIVKNFEPLEEDK